VSGDHHDPGWNFPLAGERSAVRTAPVLYTPVGDLGTLRQRLLDAAKGKRGDAWKTIRKAAMGERLLSLHDGPQDPSAPVALGVDEYLSKQVIWTLAADPTLRDVPPAEIAQAFAPSLAILRADALEAKRPNPDLWTPEHFSAKWIQATEKSRAKEAASDDFIAKITALTKANAERETPAVVQIADRFFVLDDRDPECVTYLPTKGVSLRELCRNVWPQSETMRANVLDIEGESKRRPMATAEIVETYGRAVQTLAYEFAAEAPYLDDLTLVLPTRQRPGSKADAIEGVEDREVAQWLATLDPTDGILDWIAFAHPRHCARSSPALALMGASHIGKSLLAHALALAVGMPRATDLARAFGQFASALTFGPILFADEGIPRHRMTQVPLTEEVRKLITDSHHLIEGKGSDTPIHLRGAVRVVLAANSRERLFPGTYNAHDVAALMRRLYVLSFEDEAQAAEAKAAQERLGHGEGDIERLRRVARHIVWIQETRKISGPPAPQSSGLDRDLRRGSDVAKAAIEAMEAGIPADWIGVKDRVLWVQPGTLSMRCATTPQALARALGAYTVETSKQHRTNPLTGATDAARTRWTGLNVELLRTDGVQV